MGHVRDLWTTVGPHGRRVRTERHGRGKRWVARWEEAGRTRSKAFATKDAATAHLARVELDLQVGRPVGGREVTVAQWVEVWLSRQLGWRASTAVDARRRLELHVVPVLGTVPVGEVTRGMVVDMAAGWSMSPRMARGVMGYLSSCLQAAVVEGLAVSNPARGVRLPRPERTTMWLPSMVQLQVMRERLAGPVGVVVDLAAGTGMRPGEWRGLTWDRVDLGAGVVRVDRQMVAESGAPVWGPPKTSAGVRSIALAPVTVEALVAHREQFEVGVHGLVVAGERGGAVGRSRAALLWRRATEGMGAPAGVGWHALRHYHASLLIAAGLSPRAVADRLGHRNVSETLDTYSHLWGDDEERSVAAVQAALGG